MTLEDRVEQLANEVQRLRRRQRRAMGLGALVLGLGLALAHGQGQAVGASDKEHSIDKLVLVGEGGLKASLSLSKSESVNGLPKTGLNIHDENGGVRVRFGWVTPPAGRRLDRPVTTLGLYNGKGGIIQEYPID